MKARVLAVLSASVLFCLAAVPAHASQGEYLALGDSVAFGYSPLLDHSLATNFIGYPDIVAQRLGLQLTNSSCPGETSGGFIDRTAAVDYKCIPYTSVFPLHVSYSTSQLAFALSFLTAHPDTQLVTMDIGANDVFRLEDTVCHFVQSCINAGLVAVLTQIDVNLRIIFGEIRSVAHYTGMLVTLDYYGLTYDAAGQAGTNALNTPIIDATLANGGMVASGFDAFETRALAHGGSSCAAGLLIELPTGLCDVHPSPQGRDALAGVIDQTIEMANPNF